LWELSDLALSGGNTWLKKGQPHPEAEDELLTAEDVTGMDLLDPGRSQARPLQG